MNRPVPPPMPAGPDRPTWCTCCEIHVATTFRPICPVCADKKAREER